MIDTVFYYVDSFDEYDYRQKVGEIAPHTIVFVGENKSIYKNGECYSIGDDEKIKEIVKELFIGDESPLPIATREKLGGIIVGDILSIDENGVLAVDVKALVEKIMADPEIIEILNQEIIKIEGLHGKDGATPEIIDDLWYINGQSTGVQARGTVGPQGPQGPAGKDGKDGATPEIRNGYWFINGQNTNVRAEGRDGKDGADGKDGSNGSSGADGNNGSDGNDGTSTTQKDIEDAIEDLQDRWDKLNDKIEDEIKDLFQDWEFMKENLFDKLDPDQIGSFSNFGEDDVDAYLQAIGMWKNDGDTKVYIWSEISQKINDISFDVNAIKSAQNGDVDALRGWMKTYIDTELDTAFAELGALYANKDQTEKIIEWLYSGLVSGANSTGTWNSLYSAAVGGDYKVFGGLHTAIEKLSNNQYVAKTDLQTAVKNEVTKQISTSGLSLKAEDEGTAASLYSYLDGRYASVKTAVTKDELSGNTQSSVTISGDLINFESGRSKFKGEVEATKFFAGKKDGLNITIEGENYDDQLPAPGYSKICFNQGVRVGIHSNQVIYANVCKAFFTSEGEGMQLYIKDSAGNWKKINFDNFIPVDSSVGTTNHIDLYTWDSSAKQMKFYKQLYYNDYGTFYQDQSGNTLVTSQLNNLWSDCYIMDSEIGKNVATERTVSGSTQTRIELRDCIIYKKVTFDSTNGAITINNNLKKINVAGTNMWLNRFSRQNETTIPSSQIYFGTDSTTPVSSMTGIANPGASFNIRPLIYPDAWQSPEIVSGGIYKIVQVGTQNTKPIFGAVTF